MAAPPLPSPTDALASAPAAPTRWDGVLVRFGEIGIKSAPVRRAMLDRLAANVQDALLRRGLEGGVEPLGARLWLKGPDPPKLADAACHVFGVVSASPARLLPTSVEGIAREAARLALAHPRPWRTFAVRARREGQHAFSSQDVAVAAGSAIGAAAQAAGRPAKVDLEAPDLAVEVDVRQARAFLFTQTLPGPGGIPVGTQGRVVCLLSDEASFLAAWLAMRRGCRPVPVHAGTTGSLPIDAASRLADWGMAAEVEVLPACTGRVAKPVLLEAAARIAAERKAAAIVTGDGLDSGFGPAAGDTLVLRPLAGLDPEEARRWLERSGLAGLADGEGQSIIDPAATETVESLLSMRRSVRL